MRPLLFAAIVLTASLAAAQVSVAKQKPGAKDDPVPRSDRSPASAPDTDSDSDSKDRPTPPRSNDESSSRDNIIDLSPPRNDNKRPVREYDEEEESSSTGVNELKPWNPHKAEKANEVGEYYLKEKNYKAALSRFREALEYKPRDARATYRLGETLEKMGQEQESLQRYEEYLKILKNGPFAEQARKGVDRLKAKLTSKS
ncbi:MAG TPA: tetratricopeptide repeat protein [Terriglobales bacterium]|nr:tetratricopeptide repeat protein [Terriglobales bacterium]